MPLEHLALDAITEADLQQLIVDGIAEDKTIDFKRDAYAGNRAGCIDFLTDISAFANTAGGHLLIGMDAVAGIASAMPGVAIADADLEKRRLEQMAQGGLQPRIAGFAIQPIRLANGNYLFLVRVPKSWNPPHRIIRDGVNRFYARAGGHNYEPQVDELRHLFEFAPTLAERIRDFRMDRVLKIIAGESPLAIHENSTYLLHILPLESFGSPQRIPIGELFARFGEFVPLATVDFDRRINLDGVLTYPAGADRDVPHAYTQVWRDGKIETARSPLVRAREDGQRIVFGGTLEGHFINAAVRYTQELNRLGVRLPYLVFLTLIGVKNVHYNRPQPYEPPLLFDRDIVSTSEVVLNELLVQPAQIAGALRPAFDEIANAAGLLCSPSFGAAGNWAPGQAMRA